MDSVWLPDDYKARAALGGDTTAPIVIVGGGIAGVAAAYYLAKRACPVVLLERGTIGGGATGRSVGLLLAGIHLPYSVAKENHGAHRARVLWTLSLENHLLIRDLLEKEGIDCGYARNGSRREPADEREREILRRSAEELRADGFRADFADALVAPEDGEIDPVRFVRGLAAAAERAGARVYERTPATALEGATAVTPHGRVRAEMALLATNAWTAPLAGLFDEVIAPVRAQALATEPAAPVLSVPAVTTWGMDLARQLPDGRIVASGGRHVAPGKEYSTAERVTDPVQEWLEAWVRRRAPGARVSHRWAGILGFTCDELPCVGPLPGAVHTYVAVGWHGTGLSFAVVCGRMVAEMMLDGRTNYPGEIFSVRRHV